MVSAFNQVYTMCASQSIRHVLENGMYLFRPGTYFLKNDDAIWRSFTPLTVYIALSNVPSKEFEPVIHW